MAMRKEPARRYASVGQFSEDIRRHRDGLPVIARKDTVRYRAAKFVRRHRIGVAAAALVILALLGGIIATVWAAQAARHEKAKAQSINAFLEQMIESTNPQLDFPRAHRGVPTVTEALDQAVQRLENGDFASDPKVRGDLERIIAGAYLGQGKGPEALQHTRKWVALQPNLYRRNDRRILDAMGTRAWLLFNNGEMAESEKLYREVVPRQRAEQRKGNVKTEDLMGSQNTFGYLRRTQGDSKEAESLSREVLSLKSQLPKKYGYAMMVTRSTLASTLAAQSGHLLFGPHYDHYPTLLTTQGLIWNKTGRMKEAEAIVREALKLRTDLLPKEHFWIAIAKGALGECITTQERFDEAKPLLAESHATLKARLGPNDPRTQEASQRLAQLYDSSRRPSL